MKTSVANPIIPYLLLRLRIASRGHDVLFRGAGRGYELGDGAGDLDGLIEFAIRQVRWSCLARNFGLPRLKPRSSRGWKEFSSAFPKQFFLKMYCLATVQKRNIRTYTRNRSEWLFLRRMNAMLVLTRKPGEKIHIGSGITITVVEINGNKIRLGIDAPEDVPIFRAELYSLLARIGTEPAEPASRELASAF